MAFTYLIICIYFVYLGYKSYRTIMAKRQIKNILLIGHSYYRSILMMILSVLIIPIIFTLPFTGKYVLILLIFLLPAINDRVNIGDNGIKINDTFFPLENILCYYKIEGEANQYELSIVGKESLIKITIHKQTKAGSIEGILDEWLNKA